MKTWQKTNEKGFSVFTPMVGALIIAIAMLIIASIIQNERVNMAGLIQSYRTSKMAGMSKEIKSRTVGHLRSEINSKLSQSDTMVILVPPYNCTNKEVNEAFDTMHEDYEGSNRNVCVNRTLHELGETLGAKLGGVTLLESTMEAVVENVVGRGMIMDVRPGDFTGMGDVLQERKLLDCGEEECSDGRIKFTVNFTKIKDRPIAIVETNESSIKVYADPVVKKYTTTEPYGLYAFHLGNSFQNFTLMNKSWHNAGGLAEDPGGREGNPEDHPGEKGAIEEGWGNGSQWYHYNYVVHKRYAGADPNRVEYGTEYRTGFNQSIDNKPINLTKELKTYLEDFKEEWGGDPPNWRDSSGMRADIIREPVEDYTRSEEAGDEPIGGEPIGRWSIDNTPTELGWDQLKHFVNGNLTKHSSGIEPGVSALEKLYWTAESIEPGGDLRKPSDGRYSESHNYLPNLSTGAPPSDGIEISPAINSTHKYSERRNSSMLSALQKIQKSLDENDEVKIGLGFTDETPKYTLNVTSTQFFSVSEGDYQDASNWECGQFITQYMTNHSDYGNVDDTLSAFHGPDSCPQEREGSNQNCPWFYSLPVNFTCETKVLVGVKEKHELYRSNHTHPGQEPSRKVFQATFFRIKRSYNEPENYDLWEHSSADPNKMESDRNQLKEESMEDFTVRECNYSVSINQEEELEKSSIDCPPL